MKQMGKMLIIALAILSSSASDATAQAKSKWMGAFVRDVLKQVVAGVAVNAITEAATQVAPQSTRPSAVAANRPSQAEADRLGALATRHFMLNESCEVERVIQFYSDSVHYDGHDASRADVRRKKLASCAQYAQGSRYTIREGSMTVAYTLNDRAFEIVDYIVDFDVYNSRTHRSTQGASRIRVVFDVRSAEPRIVGESHVRIAV